MENKMSNTFETMSPEISDFIQNIVNTAKLLEVEAVVVDSESVRGKGEGILILQKDNLPEELGFDGIAFGDIMTLGKRMNAFDDFKMQYVMREKESGYKFPYKLRMVSGKSRIEFVCLNPSQVKAPKNLKDPTYFSFMMDTDSVNLLASANSLMQSDRIVLSGKDDTVQFSASDDSAATLSHVISNDLVKLAENDQQSFVYPYKYKNVVGVFRYLAKQTERFEVCVTKRGFITIEVNGLNINILREVD